MDPTRQFGSIGPSATRDVENLVQRKAGGKWSTAVGKAHEMDTALEPRLGKKETIIKTASGDYSRARNIESARAAIRQKGRLLHFLNNRKGYGSEKRLELSQRMERVGKFGGAY